MEHKGDLKDKLMEARFCLASLEVMMEDMLSAIMANPKADAERLAELAIELHHRVESTVLAMAISIQNEALSRAAGPLYATATRPALLADLLAYINRQCGGRHHPPCYGYALFLGVEPDQHWYQRLKQNPNGIKSLMIAKQR